MLTLGQHFEELQRNIRPPQDRLDAADELPPQVRCYLEEHSDFATLAPHTKLVGSYAQGMSVGDVKDVDFLVRVDGDPDNNEPEARTVIQDLKKALDGLPRAIGLEGESGIDIERARRSVHVYFHSRDFHVDAVPCVAPAGLAEPLYVPDRGWNRWVRSHPVGYLQLLDDLDRAHGRKVKSLGRLLKHFRNHQMQTRRPKSYWLGALLVHHVRRENGLDMSLPLAVLFRDLLDAIYRQYASLLPRTDGATPNIPDPLLGHNVSWNWSRSHFETFMRRIEEARGWASEALDLDDDMRAQAIALWQRIFGAEYFPSNIEEAARATAAAAVPGRSYVTNSGLVTGSAADVATVTRPTTFHGSSGG